MLINCSGSEGDESGNEADRIGAQQEALTADICATATEHNDATLTCPAGQTIAQIVFASYGNPGGSCGAFTTDASCDASTSTSVVQSACLGKNTCTITADNGSFPDPCSGIQKSLAIEARCSGTPAVDAGTGVDSGTKVDSGTGSGTAVCGTAPEHSITSVSCPAGQTITSVSFASYGTPTGTCGAFKTSSCNASNSTSVATAACVGKSSCSITADNGAFGDPCPGSQKALDLQVQCGGGTATDAGAVDSGTKTDSGTVVDSGSPDSGTATIKCGTATEHNNAVATCPSGQVISAVDFASYGSPTGTCGAFKTSSSCNASNSLSVVKTACIGKASCSLTADNNAFGDPCPGVGKSLDFQVECTPGTVVTPPPPGNSNVALNDTNIWVTPENWFPRSTSVLETSSPGAYFKMGFTGTSLTLTLDTSSFAFEMPKIGVQIDGGAIKYIPIGTIYSSALTVPLASGLAAGNHQARVSLEGLGYVDRWESDIDHLKIIGITIDSGAHTFAPTLRPKRIVAYGDSISEGATTLSNENFVANAQWSTTWEAVLGDKLNAEVSAIAYQGQGYEQTGQGKVPGFISAWNFVRSGMARTFSSPDYVFIHHGSNGTTTQSDVTTMLSRLRSVYPNAAIYQDVPFGGYARAAITAGFQAQSDPKVYFIDLGTQGQNVVTANSTDGEHPTPTGDALLAQMMLPFIH